MTSKGVEFIGRLWKRTVQVDNIFKLHYRVTSLLLLLFSFVLGSSGYFGRPIYCMTSDESPSTTVENYCWIISTYITDNYKYINGTVGKTIIHPGIGSSTQEKDFKYLRYYQWLHIVLFLQALLFCLPYFFWMTWEGGKILQLTKLGHEACIDFVQSNFNKLNSYFVFYVSCEFLNFINVMLQIFFMNFFLNAEFLMYGPNAIRMTQMDPLERTDAISKVFPKLTKCNFFKFGPSGSIANVDALCVLPFNSINEKVIIFLWFWFVSLGFLSGSIIIFRTFLLFSSRLRYFFLYMLCYRSSPEQINLVTSKCHIGDWFFIHELGKCMTSSSFRILIRELSERTKEDKK